jgi:hypothetical protein
MDIPVVEVDDGGIAREEPVCRQGGARRETALTASGKGMNRAGQGGDTSRIPGWK